MPAGCGGAVQAGLESTGNVLIQVTDQGRWQLGDTPGSGQGWAGSRGLSVISQVTDEVSIAPSPAGTTVVMRRRVHHPVPVGPAAAAGEGQAGSPAGPGGVASECPTSR